MKKHGFSSCPVQKLSAMGQPGAAKPEPLYMCVLDKQVVFVNKIFRFYTLCIQVFFSTLPSKKLIHVKLCNLQFELGSLNFPV